jgi:CheY-like chemotaxis protein/anti-sigma regulatory factor (Ser/Thr protein kinase)
VSKPQILIVDDHALDRKLLTHYLEPEGYSVVTASDGQEGWEMLSREPGRFDVVLLDRSMPRMNGLELLMKIKSDEQLRTVPTIMQTALTKREEILEGIRAGAYYYLTKPYDVEMLRSVVRTAIDDYRGYRELQDEMRKGADTLRLMREAVFGFRTVEQARALGMLLANTCPDPSATVVGLTELLVNAVEHGNLGITYEEKTRLGSTFEWTREVDRRLALPENAEKEAEVQFVRDDERISFVIRDQGAGFDFNRFLTIDPQRAFHTHGRGIAIANRLSFSHLEYRGKGNEVVGTIDLATS